MTRDGADATVTAEMALADECLAAARHEAAGGFHRRAVSSVCYAVFHAARAALARAGIEARSHAGVRHLFGRHMIMGGAFPDTDARLLRHMQKDREDADYAHVAPFGPVEVEAAITCAADFLARVRRHLQSTP